MDKFGIDFKDSDYLRYQAREVLNKGKKNPVSNLVVQALDDFYTPFNQRLAKLLNDKRFLYERS